MFQLKDAKVKKMLELLEKIDSSYYPVFKDLFRDVEAGWYSMKLKWDIYSWEVFRFFVLLMKGLILHYKYEAVMVVIVW